MILFDHVTKRYGKGTRAVLDDISLHISANEFVFLVGKSGAGKSTLLKMITKEATPDSGKIIIGGIDLDYVKRRHIPDYRRRIGVVFQDYKLLPSRTVFENVAFALEIAGMSNHETPYQKYLILSASPIKLIVFQLTSLVGKDSVSRLLALSLANQKFSLPMSLLATSMF